MTINLSETLTFIEALMQDIGPHLREGFQNPKRMMTKQSAVDIVTETDRSTEAIILRELQQHFPDHSIVGEETGEHRIEGAEYFWFVDPIDGTTNFASGLPYFTTSIAVTDAELNPLVGVVFAPMHNEMYSATRGGGAFLNGERLSVSPIDTLLDSVLASGFSYDKHTNPDNNLAQWAAFTKRVRGVRRFGSAALDMAYIAAGRLEGYWERSLNQWDVMAGLLLVQEAGGMFSTYEGDPRPQAITPNRYVVSNGHLHQVMLDVLNASYAENDADA